MKSKSDDKPTEIQVLELTQGLVNFAVVGTSPLIFNRMSEKAKRELLMPHGRKSTLERSTTLKHNPIEEYRDSVYRDSSADGPTRLMLPCPAFKGAMVEAALRMPGVTKTEMGMLMWVKGYRVSLYGVPQLFMTPVIQAGVSRTPDIRTRAIVPSWGCVVSVAFVSPQLTGQAIGNLFAAAGVICGVGDYRQQKGKGNFGQFRLADGDDAEFAEIIAAGGRAAQDAALAEPAFYDEESEELYGWFDGEVETRKKRGSPSVAKLAA